LIAAVCFLFTARLAQVTFAADKEAGMAVPANKEVLVVYFSHSGNTREIAAQIQKITGADIFEIKTVRPYPDSYDATVAQAKKELASDYKPALQGLVENINSYNKVFIGYPIWYGTLPPPVKAFLAETDLSGKTIAPFCTHGGGGSGKSITELLRLCPKSTVIEGLVVRGSDVKAAQNEVSEWLRKNKLIR